MPMSMRNPFPGMNPWLESSWGDLHHSIVQYARDQISKALPEPLYAAVEETVYILDSDEVQEVLGTIRPDAAVFHKPSREDQRPSDEGGGVAVAVEKVAEPIRIALPELRVSEGMIAIRAADKKDALVTAIEVISPSNKYSQTARRKYVKKRKSYYAAGASVVEIDLLRAGKEIVDVPWRRVKKEDLAPYKACVHRCVAGEFDEVEYFPMPLRNRLPKLGIPLRNKDKDAVLDLQSVVDLAWENGRYTIRTDYARQTNPKLSPEDAEWAAGLVKLAAGSSK